MGKALVIKNADFSTNVVTTISFEAEVPCTGVAWNSPTASVTSLGVFSLPYTFTPSNTTDTPSITSSDSNVVSVSGNTLSAVGIGTATLTLSCNGHSATCTVTVSVTEEPVYLVGYESIASTSQTGMEHDAILINGSSKSRMVCVRDYADGNFTKELTYLNGFDVGDVTAIKIPANATKIHINASGVYASNDSSKVYFLDANTQYTHNSDGYLPITSEANLTPITQGSVKVIDEDVTVPSGSTGFVVIIRLSSSAPLSDISTEADAKTYAEGTTGISISYKTA